MMDDGVVGVPSCDSGDEPMKRVTRPPVQAPR
jgi:hypothetical protein